MKMLSGRLVEDWRHAHRWWSVRLIALEAVLQVVPAEKFLTIYSYLPEDLQALMPGRTTVLIGLALLAALSRIVAQKKDSGE